MSYAQPYASVKVVDLTQGLAGPYTSALLAQHGAQISKVEPQHGDWSRRTAGKAVDELSPSFIIANLGKRSIVVDLKTTEGLAIVQQLVTTADIFMESFRPGVTERLGLGYDAVAAWNPRIIYLSVSGFGQRGPLRERPATDGVIQAFSGFMHLNKGNDRIPHRAGVALADLATSLYNLQALQAALWARQSEGRGCYIDNSLLRTAASLYNMNIASEYVDGPESPLGIAPSGIYETTDGFINIICLYDRDFPVLCDILGLHAFRDHADYRTAVQRYERRDTLDVAIREAVCHQSTAYWSERLAAGGVLHERINTFSDFLSHPHTTESGAIGWVDYPGIGTLPLANPAGMRPYDPDQPLYAPRLGEHTVTILRELGYDADRIDALIKEGIVSVNQNDSSTHTSPHA